MKVFTKYRFSPNDTISDIKQNLWKLQHVARLIKYMSESLSKG